MNRLLDNDDREYYKPTIRKMFELIPEMMGRKIPAANCQQAFAIDMVEQELNKKEFWRILCVGCREDTAYEYLTKLGYFITGIDPEVNCDLHTFYEQTDDVFDVIFSVSVIEHVKDDEEFIDEICKLLKPGGLAILTCDFKNDYKKGDPLIYPDFRFYTEVDLGNRLRTIIENNNCTYVGTPNWYGKPDFQLDGFNYSFATIMFRKSIYV
jgi:SAM-dependent methyltransferase